MKECSSISISSSSISNRGCVCWCCCCISDDCEYVVKTTAYENKLKKKTLKQLDDYDGFYSKMSICIYLAISVYNYLNTTWQSEIQISYKIHLTIQICHWCKIHEYFSVWIIK